MRTWKNIELKKEEAEKLKAFLKTNKITYEPSGCYDYIHFEILCNERETETINQFLEGDDANG